LVAVGEMAAMNDFRFRPSARTYGPLAELVERPKESTHLTRGELFLG